MRATLRLAAVTAMIVVLAWAYGQGEQNRCHRLQQQHSPLVADYCP